MGGNKAADELDVQRKRFEQEVLKEMCTCNGLTYGRLQQEGPGLRLLEMFFSGYPKMVGLNFFPNLQVLCIMGQTITHIENLIYCPHLKECWIAECAVKKIDGLENCHSLRKLFLYGNDIEKIENLDQLGELQVLWLNNNRIKNIEGLAPLKYLRDLNLAENLIETIGHSLDNLQYLEKVELSGNRLSTFKDVTNLGKVLSLWNLGLKSPLFESNPVGLLCNYSTYVLYHLPQLCVLDLQDVSAKVLKETAEATVMKKKLFYRMRLRSMKRDLCHLTSNLSKIKSQLLAIPQERIRQLVFAVKETELEMGEWADIEVMATQVDTAKTKEGDEQQYISMLQLKRRILDERVTKWLKKMTEVEQYYREAVDDVKQVIDNFTQRLIVELETGGNVRYEDGKPSDIWFTSCHDLILSRFCVTDFKEHGVTGLKILRITRVHNRLLKLNFEEALADMMEDEEEGNSASPAGTNAPSSASTSLVSSRSGSYRKLIEYLFWVWDPEVPGGLHEPARVLQEGFMDSETYQKLGKDAAVPLTNSLSLADKHRIAYMNKRTKGKEMSDPCPYRRGQIIIAKAFLGKPEQYTAPKSNVPAGQNASTKPEIIEKKHYPKADTVYKPRKDPGNKSGTSSCSSDSGSRCECASRQCEWFVFNPELVLPEYVVEFEYLSKTKPSSPFANLTESLLASPEVTIALPEYETDDDVHQMEPVLKNRPRLATLTDDYLLKECKAEALHDIVVLNLHGNGLSRLRPIQSLTSLKRLIVSFNDLTRLDDIANMNIQYLDASFNKIDTLDGMKSLTRLLHLDVSWNRLFNTRDDISILRKHTPSLQVLELRHNNWQKPEGLRLRAIGRIKSLTVLNDEPVTESEATAALRMAAGSRISQVSLMAHSRTDLMEPKTLSLEPTASVLAQISRMKPDRIGEADNHWYSQVTSLNLDNQHISKLSNLERLENLRWASFNDNDITRIEGLEACCNLEELSLDRNCIIRIEGLVRLGRLRVLSLGHNYITNVDKDCLSHKPNLEYLCLENNSITSLIGLRELTGLCELYISNNCIDNVREVFYLKNLSNLAVLDLYGNPVVSATDSYRLFVIYHLKMLRALDGIPIESLEGNQARDMFGGRLTPDFIAERLGHANFTDIRELDFPQSNIRSVDLGNPSNFLHLRSLNLENNSLTSFSGLINLVNLRVLCLNHNHIEGIVAKPKQAPIQAKSRLPQGATVSDRNAGNQALDAYNSEAYTPLMENLQVLHLAYNGIKDMAGLHLSRLPSLKALFLQGNEISRVEGLEGLHDLRELVLDRNKIKAFGKCSLINQWNLQELHIEENRIRELSNISHLENLQRLFLGMNRIQDIGELEKLEILPNLIELSLVGNAVARRLLHRPMLVFRMPNLVVIDGIPVTEEERAKAEVYFLEQQPTQQIITAVESSLPGIGQYKAQIPIKVTNMQLISSPFGAFADRTFGGTLQISEEVIQYEMQKGRIKKAHSRSELSPSLNQSSLQSRTTSQGSGAGGVHHNTSNILGSRSQQHLSSQVPYVPYQPSSSSADHHKYSDSLNKANKGFKQ